MMFRLWICAVLGTMVMVGCDSSGPELTSIKGKVTLNGRPLVNKSLVFMAIGNTPGHGAAGWTDANGNYDLKAVVPGAVRVYDGIPPGRYRAMVFEPSVRTDLPAEEGGEATVFLAPGIGRGKSEIPAVYRSPRSPLVFDVPVSGGKIDIQLKSNPG